MASTMPRISARIRSSIVPSSATARRSGLAAEVVVHEARLHAGPLGHFADGHTRIPLLGHQLVGRGEQRFARLARAGAGGASGTSGGVPRSQFHLINYTNKY